MLDKHEFKIAWALISHCTLSTSFKQKFPWNVKEFQLRQIKKISLKCGGERCKFLLQHQHVSDISPFLR